MLLKPQLTGLHPLILLGPNRPEEVFSVLNVVRFYRKLMVRHAITKIILPRRGLLDGLHYWHQYRQFKIKWLLYISANILLYRKIAMAGGKTRRINYELVTSWMESKARFLLACFLCLLVKWLVVQFVGCLRLMNAWSFRPLHGL